MIIRTHITIAAPREVVWEIFSDMENWRDWNAVCRKCRYESGSTMAVDSCFSFSIKPLFFPLRVSPRIIRCQPGHEIVWQGGRFGIQAEHLFQFNPVQAGIQIVSEERFKGFLLPALKILGVPRRLHRLTESFLHALKQQAESCCNAS